MDTSDAFEPFGSLLKMLVPRASGIAIFDGRGEQLWCSVGQLDADTQSAVDAWFEERAGETRGVGGSMEALPGDAVVYLSPLRAGDAQTQGLVAVNVASPGANPQPYSLYQALVNPVIECLQRQLRFQTQLQSFESGRVAPLDDLELLVSLGDGDGIGEEQMASLRSLVRRTVEHFGVDLGVLVIPDKQITICEGGSGSEAAEAELLTRTQRNLLAMAQLSGKPFVSNRIGNEGRSPSGDTTRGLALPYRILSCPVRDRADQVQGIFALFAGPACPDFESRHTRMMSLLGRRAMAVLQSQYDSLTGTLVRPPWERLVGQRVVSESGSAHMHALLYADIDQMHVVNDRFGAEAGDEVIVRFSQIARRELGENDEIARIAGDRFAIFLFDRSLEQAREIGQRLTMAMNQLSFLRAEQSLRISVSVGVAAVSPSEEGLSQAMAAAEVACKAAKDRGRNRVETYQEDDASIIRRHQDIVLVGQLHRALRENEFRLHAQPIYDLRGGGRTLSGYEFLLRMLDDTGATLAPDKFLSAAERYQLMPAIDRWVIVEALATVARHVQLAGHGDWRFYINVSGQSLGDSEFLTFVQDAVERSGAPPECLVFEITETAAVAKLERARQFIVSLSRIGCRFALDDFGTGLSSFAYLQSLPVHVLKIDGTFVRRLAGSRVSASMVAAIAQVARVMELETIAESVESAAVLQRVEGLGVSYAQGFHLGRPAPLEETMEAAAASETAGTSPAPRDEVRQALP